MNKPICKCGNIAILVAFDYEGNQHLCCWKCHNKIKRQKLAKMIKQGMLELEEDGNA
ncbi:MAG: hypothetical protein JRI45_10215 [Deltaproteobacteria bacterium]|nr:hypothetical protein [Deltaproteobacteria bacterium]